MSLHTLASHLQSAGRGEDKVLVHMTPGEVKGLQALAMSQGGSLSINPQTGLPEAGILSSLLPMVAGFFLGPAGLGLTAMQSALAVGALGTAATGSLGKGFMMGLGAYGGAGLGSGLVTAGTPAAAPTTSTLAGNTTLSNVGGAPNLGAVGGTDTFANLASKTPVNPATGGFNGLQGFNSQSIMAPNAMQNVPSWAATTPVPAPSVPLSNASEVFSKGFVNPPVEVSQIMPGSVVNATPQITAPSNVVDLSSKGISDIASQTRPVNMNMSIPGGQQASNIIEGQMSVPKSPFVDKTTVASPSNWDKAKAGFDRATGSWEGAKEVWNATPTGTGYGLAATGMSALQAQQEEAAEDARRAAAAAAAERRGHYRPYDFSTEQDPRAYANTSTAESIYFVEPRFVARPIEKIAKEGGIMSLAVGGQVEQMSAENAIGSNAMYPQSQLNTPMYSNPMMQRPMPTDVIQSGIDAPTDRYTGEYKFASGGSATAKAKEATTDTKYTYDPATMQYTQTTTSTPAPTTNKLTGNPLIDGMFGLTPYMLGTSMAQGGGGGNFTGELNFAGLAGGLGSGINPTLAAFYKNQQAAPQSTTTTQTSGGITTQPYTPPTEGIGPINPIAPNINTQPQQNIDRQLGLEAFYPMMEQQLALKGSNLQAQGYASGGPARGTGIVNMSGIEKRLGEKMFPNPNPTNDPKADAYVRKQMLDISKDVASKGTAAYGNGRTSMDYKNDLYKQYFSGNQNGSTLGQSSYNYNPATMQYTDNAGKVTGGMQPQFIPMEVMQPEQQIGMTGYQGYAGGGELIDASPKAVRRLQIMGGVAGMGGRELPPWATEAEINALANSSMPKNSENIKSAPTYTYNPATMQYRDQAGNVTGGLGGYQGYANGGVARFGGGGAMDAPSEDTKRRMQEFSKLGSEAKGNVIYQHSQGVDVLANKSPLQATNQMQLQYLYNPQTQQYTDPNGNVTGGLAAFQGYAEGGTANGGYSLGSYSDGGRLLRGPGDGVSDSIPASIGDRQPARLADGEFVVPARIVSEIGNGSTEAGARKLYAMMDRVQKARRKTVGKGKVAVNTKADKLLPA